MHIVEYILLGLSKSIISRQKKYKSVTPTVTLRILLVGYSGKRNTGAEARSAQIINQIKQMQLPYDLKFGVLTLSPVASQDYYSKDVTLIPVTSIFFKTLSSACREYDFAILAEGSCFTSVTSNVAAMYFITAAALMKAQGKPCLAYGVEAGPMPPVLVNMVKKHCSDVFFIARTQVSLTQARRYGLQAQLGTDTAWLAASKSQEWGQSTLRARVGRTLCPIVGVSPINAFIRPIRPSLWKYLLAKITGRWRHHYDKFYFYSFDQRRKAKLHNYITAIANGIEKLQGDYQFEVVMIEMEPMDADIIDQIETHMNKRFARISASQYNASQLASMLQNLQLLLTSRYHAYVLAMKAGVPSIAISKDQRLTEIFNEHGQQQFCLSTHETDVDATLAATIDAIMPKMGMIQKKLLLQFTQCQSEQQAMDQLAKSVILEKLRHAY